MLHRVALVRTDVSEELRASFIMIKRIVEQRKTLAITGNRRIVTAAKTSNLTLPIRAWKQQNSNMKISADVVIEKQKRRVFEHTNFIHYDGQ
jgi:hypothetical protein